MASCDTPFTTVKEPRQGQLGGFIHRRNGTSKAVESGIFRDTEQVALSLLHSELAPDKSSFI